MTPVVSVPVDLRGGQPGSTEFTAARLPGDGGRQRLIERCRENHRREGDCGNIGQSPPAASNHLHSVPLC